MIGYILSVATIIIVIAVEIIILNKIKVTMTGKTKGQAGWALLILAIGLAILIIATFYLYPLISELLLIFSASTELPPLLIAMCFAGIVIVALWLARSGIKEMTGSYFSDNAQRLLDGITVLLSLYVAISFSGITGSESASWLWSWRIFLVGGSIIFMGIAYRWWFPRGQDGFGVAVTYGLDVVLSNYFFAAFGWSVFANIQGTLFSTAFFIIFNMAVFWLAFPLGDPKRKLKKRLGYWIVTPYTIALLLASGWMVFLQASGQLSFHEQEIARKTTAANQTTEQVERVIASIGIEDVQKAFDESIESLNELLAKRTQIDERIFDKMVAEKKAEIKGLRDQLAEYNIAQQKIERANIVLPEAVADTVRTIRLTLADTAIKNGDQKYRWERVPGTSFSINGEGLDKEGYNSFGNGLTLRKGWRTIAEADNPQSEILFYFDGSFKSFFGGFILPVRHTITIKNGLGIKIPKDEKVKFWAERKVPAY